MGVFETIFKKPKQIQEVKGYFKMLDGYCPVFTTYDGGLYEQELTRAAINAFATHCSKLIPEVVGSAYKELDNILKFKPNPFMSTSQFLYRVATILSVNNTCYIVPIEDKYGYIAGYYPVVPSMTEVLDVSGVPYLRYTFGTGERASIEFSKVGMLTNFQYKNDFKGEDNEALRPTLELINTQNQGIIEGVKNGASIRFMAKINNFMKKADLIEQQKEFSETNLSSSNDTGVMLFGNQYSEVKQIDSKPFIVSDQQMKLIQENVCNYFGCNLEILQNKAIGDSWSAYYEGKIEPFAIQLSLALSNMTYSRRELAQGNQIILTANRLQYMTNKDKLDVSSQMFDRGLLSRNDIREIWNMPLCKDGDKYYIRREYVDISNLDKELIDSARVQKQRISNVTTTENASGTNTETNTE